MTTKSIKIEKTVVIILFILVAIFSGLSGNAQNVKLDATGNYVAIKSHNDTAKSTQTGKTYTDSKGNTYPVMISKNGKLFVIRTSKSGNRYNYYLKP